MPRDRVRYALDKYAYATGRLLDMDLTAAQTEEIRLLIKRVYEKHGAKKAKKKQGAK